MAIIANLDVTLNAVTKKFDDGLKRSRKMISGWKAAVVAAGAAAGALAVAMKNVITQMNEIDVIAKASAKLGLATEELVGLRLAASEFSGVGSRQFDTALQRMTRRVAEAAAGTGEAKKAIAELGLDARQLAAAGPAEAFKRIAEAIRTVESPADRLRLAFKLFDSEGAALVTTLGAGRKGIEGVERAASRLGITFSKVDAAKVEAANDAWGRMKASITGVWRQLTVALAPTLEKLANEFTEFAVKEGPAMAESIQAIGQAARIAAEPLLILKDVVNSLKGQRVLVPDLGKIRANVPKQLPSGQAAFNRVLDAQNAQGAKAIGNLKIQLQPLTDFWAEFTLQMRQAREQAVRFEIPILKQLQQSTGLFKRFAQEVRIAALEFDFFASVGIDGMIADAQAAISSFFQAKPPGMGGANGATPAALEAGSAAAFSAARKGGAGANQLAAIKTSTKKTADEVVLSRRALERLVVSIENRAKVLLAGL